MPYFPMAVLSGGAPLITVTLRVVFFAMASLGF
jgi:hypothetical protein